MTEPLLGGANAAPLSMRATAVVASAVVRAARQLFTDLQRSRRIDATTLRNAMEAAFGASDASGAWNWKTAYDACEAATVVFLRRYRIAMCVKAGSPAAMLSMLTRITGLLPTQTGPEETESLQQFSTPIGLAFVSSMVARIVPADVVLEPSAATGLLAILAQLTGTLLDNWLTSCAHALGINNPGRPIEDAKRNCLALGTERSPATPIFLFRQRKPIRRAEGVLFATHATLQNDACGENLSRVRQVVKWFDSDFDGVIAADEKVPHRYVVERIAERQTA
jgi:P-loop containing NTP hydrolase pore-1